MAKSNSTLRKRFAQSKFAAKTNNFSESDPTGPVLELQINKIRGFNVEPPPGVSFSIFVNNLFPTAMENLRSHVDYLLSLKLPVRVKNRLLLKYRAMECQLEAVCLLLDEAEENGMVIKEGDIDPSCFDMTGFYLPEYYQPDGNSSTLNEVDED